MSFLTALLLLFVLVASIGSANVVDKAGRGHIFFDLGVVALAFLLLVNAIALRFLPAGQFASGLDLPDPAVATPMALGALWTVLVALRPFRRLLARFSRLNPDSAVHTLALVAAGLIGVNTAVTLSSGLTSLADNVVSASIGLVIGQGVVFILAALMGVGLFVRRDWPALLNRLGLTPIDGLMLRRAFLWTIGFVVFQAAVSAAYAATNPSELDLVDSINAVLLAEIDTVAEWFLLALASGIGEELLFRGALQPVFGLLPTTLLFTLPHVQYGITPIIGVIFIIGLVLGILRQRYGTTLVILIHVGYNFVLGLTALAATAVAGG